LNVFVVCLNYSQVSIKEKYKVLNERRMRNSKSSPFEFAQSAINHVLSFIVTMLQFVW